jgi:predicted RNA binding protein YcfA (HicA-like mRNA interferase family)
VSKLPQISGEECIRALIRAGFYIDRQKGSHVILLNDSGARPVVPMHRPIKKGTLRGIISDAGLTVDEFLDLL